MNIGYYLCQVRFLYPTIRNKKFLNINIFVEALCVCMRHVRLPARHIIMSNLAYKRKGDIDNKYDGVI